MSRSAEFRRPAPRFDSLTVFDPQCGVVRIHNTHTIEFDREAIKDQLAELTQDQIDGVGERWGDFLVELMETDLGQNDSFPGSEGPNQLWLKRVGEKAAELREELIRLLRANNSLVRR